MFAVCTDNALKCLSFTVHVCACAHACVCVCMHVCVCACMCVCVRGCMHACVRAWVLCMRVCMHLRVCVMCMCRNRFLLFASIYSTCHVSCTCTCVNLQLEREIVARHESKDDDNFTQVLSSVCYCRISTA